MTAASIQPPSFWLADVGESLVPRPALEGDASVDVAIVGAGFTGLWTAYYLASLNPELSIAVVESQVAGFGAAGRNGGWCSSHLSGVALWLQGKKREGAIALQRAMFDTVDEIGRVTQAEGVDCGFAKGGFLTVATNESECERGRGLVAGLREHGFSEADFRWLDAGECDERVRLGGALGGFFSPHAAAVQPAKLARGLADAVERHGVTIYERSPARAIGPGEVVLDRARLRARIVLCATEGYTPSLQGRERSLIPMHSMMVVTEPLPDSFWKEVGAEDRVVFGDMRRILCYAQRTTDGRIAMGAGGRYFWDSTVHDYLPSDGPNYRLAEQAIAEFFPQLRDVAITHRWGGAFGVPRDWKPFVRFDAKTGFGAAGGYVGNGVAAANLAARTLADLVLGRDTELLSHPWVQHQTPSWEHEPLRWLAVNGILKLGAAADRGERIGRPARLRAAVFDSVSGH
jgi:glycine/D-amino acid oxidase-like deaminating enzyme